jgi:hypothetical protein
MIDIQSIKLRDLAEITSVDFLGRDEVLGIFLPGPGEPLPVVMDFRGRHFDRAVSVLLNGVSLQFTIRSPARILATLPDSMTQVQVRSLYIITDSDTFTNSSLYEYVVGTRSETVTGVRKVTQQFIKLLMTTPGSDTFDTSSGGGLSKLPGQLQRNPHAVLATIAQSIIKVANELRDSQQGTRLPPSEKLRSIDIVELSFAKGDKTSVNVDVRVITHSKTSMPVSLALGVRDAIEGLVGGIS